MYRLSRHPLRTAATRTPAIDRPRRLFSRASLAALAAVALAACDGARPTAPADGRAPGSALAVAPVDALGDDRPGRLPRRVRRKALVDIVGSPADGGPAGVTEVRFTGRTRAGAWLHGHGTVTGYRFDRRRQLHVFTIDLSGTLAGRAIQGRGFFTGGDNGLGELPDESNQDGDVDGADFLVWKRVILSIDVEYSTDGNDL